jgi:hypothetical protein
MCSENEACLTRVVSDECDLQVTRIQNVMQRIEGALANIPPTHRHYVANALLNLAVNRMTQQEGASQTSAILMRLGDYVSSGQSAPPAERAVDLTAMNA